MTSLVSQLVSVSGSASGVSLTPWGHVTGGGGARGVATAATGSGNGGGGGLFQLLFLGGMAAVDECHQRYPL